MKTMFKRLAALALALLMMGAALPMQAETVPAAPMEAPAEAAVESAVEPPPAAPRRPRAPARGAPGRAYRRGARGHRKTDPCSHGTAYGTAHPGTYPGAHRKAHGATHPAADNRSDGNTDRTAHSHPDGEAYSGTRPRGQWRAARRHPCACKQAADSGPV